jgi:hypothetical protein
MGYHHCPIEPSDWSDGPNYEEGNCPDCDGLGTVSCNCDDRGCSKCADGERTCEGCDGSGFLDPPDFDDDRM